MVLKQETGNNLHCNLLGGFAPKTGITLTAELIYSSDDQIVLITQQNIWNLTKNIATNFLENQAGKKNVFSLSLVQNLPAFRIFAC